MPVERGKEGAVLRMLLPGFDADCRRKEGVGPFYGSVEVGGSREEVGGSREARMVVVTVRRIWLVLSEKKNRKKKTTYQRCYLVYLSLVSSRLLSLRVPAPPHARVRVHLLLCK